MPFDEHPAGQADLAASRAKYQAKLDRAIKKTENRLEMRAEAIRPREDGGSKFSALPPWLFLEPKITNLQLRILGVIGWRGGWDRGAYFSLRKLADCLDHSDHKALARAVNSLEEKGRIIVERKQVRPNGSKTVNVYWITMRPPEGWEEERAASILKDPQLAEDVEAAFADDDEAPVEEIEGEAQPKPQPGREALHVIDTEAMSMEETLAAIRGAREADPQQIVGGWEAPTVGAGEAPLGKTPLENKNKPNNPKAEEEGECSDEKDGARAPTSGGNRAASGTLTVPSEPVHNDQPCPYTGELLDAASPPPAPRSASSPRAAPPQAVRVTAALRAWCKDEAPHVNPRKALREFEAHHEKKGSKDHLGPHAEKLFRMWVVRAEKFALRKQGRAGLRKPLNVNLVTPEEAAGRAKMLAGMVAPGTKRPDNVRATIEQVFKGMDVNQWASVFQGSQWGVSDHLTLTVALRSGWAVKHAEERLRPLLANAVVQNNGTNWRLEIVRRKKR